MLEQIFGSKTRVKLLRLFLTGPHKYYYVRELARKIESQINSVRRELDNLEKLGLILTTANPEAPEAIPDIAAEENFWQQTQNSKMEKKIKRTRIKDKDVDQAGRKKYYYLNTSFVLYSELKALMLKSQLLSEKNLVDDLLTIARLNLLLLTGIFVGNTRAPVDILLVGRVNRRGLTRIIKKFEKELDNEIRYTVMNKKEYQYRKDITDRFIYDILEGKKVVVIDNLS